MSFNDFELIPADDPQSTPQQAIDAATDGALAALDQITPAPDDPPAPFGQSWQFNFASGQFVRRGQSPAQTAGFDSLAQWCLMAIYSARYAHPVFSDDFGLEEPDSIVGQLAEGETVADWQAHLVDALLVHDRITAVQNISLDWNPRTGILTILAMDIVTDEDATIAISDVSVQAGG